MNILLFEYITGGGLMEKDLPRDLVREARMMRDALLHDLHGYSLGVLLDPRVPLTERPETGGQIEVFAVDSAASMACQWQQAMSWADAVWPVAPETGGVLADLSRQVINAGKSLLGSTPDAIVLTADKLQTLRHLQSHSLACVPGWRLDEFRSQVPPPWVVKPLDGVGCEGTGKVWSLPECAGDRMVQPFVEGEVISLSALFDSGRSVLLSINRQMMEEQPGGGFHLQGCLVNAIPDEDGRWQRLCDRIASSIPGLWGYAGIDLILQGDTPMILEVNPRLTLSYTGLRRALDSSIASWVIEMACGRACLEELAVWRRGVKGSEVWVSPL